MEIDFLGLKSNQSQPTEYEKQQKNNMDLFTTDSGDDITLSLSFSTALDSQLDSQKKKWELQSDRTVPTCSSSYVNGKSCGLDNYNGDIPRQSFPVLAPRPLFYPSSSTCFVYGLKALKDKPKNSRNISKIPTTPPSDTPNCPRAGYTPTVAMARRATLARFLEKRLHRLTQARSSGFIGKSSCSLNFEASNKNSTGCNKRGKKKIFSP